MSREITNTTNKYADQDLPDGRNKFIVAGPVEKRFSKKGNEFFIWKFQHGSGLGQQVFMPNMMGGLLRALGCTETEPNKFDWDTNEQEGKSVMATVSHKPDEKDPAIIRQHMTNFEKVDDNEIPF